MRPIVEISPGLARAARSRGAAGEAWLKRLPTEIACLAQRWDLRIEAPYTNASTAYVAPATRSDGGAVVLKINLHDLELGNEVDALALWDGHGAVRVLEQDPCGLGFLIERCAPATPILTAGLPEEEVDQIATQVLRSLWVRPPEGHPFDRLETMTWRMAGRLEARYREFGHSIDRDLVDMGVRLLKDLPLEPHDDVLLHCDFHSANLLAAHRRPWLAIDPQPVVGDAAFDAVHLLLFDWRSLSRRPALRDVLQRRLDSLARSLGLDRGRIRDWSVARHISWALFGMSLGQPDRAAENLALVDALLRLD